MSLPKDLLDQADHLVKKEPKRPKQASLRRAVSAAYYALFHLLTEAAARRLIPGTGGDREALRVILRRAFGHGEMAAISKSFRSGSPPARWQDVLGVTGLTADVRKVADAFVDLQEARHEADYDAGRAYTRQEARELVRRTEEAFKAWKRAWKTHAGDTYLVALLVNARLRS